MNIHANILDILNSMVISNEESIDLLKKFSPEFTALKGIKLLTQKSLHLDYYKEFNLDEIELSLSAIYKEHLNRSRYDIKVNHNVVHTSYLSEILKTCNYKRFRTQQIPVKDKSAYTKYLEAFIAIKNSFYVQALLVMKSRFAYNKCDKYGLQVLLDELNRVLLCLDSYKYIDTMTEKINLDLGEETEFLQRCLDILINILSKLICVAIKEWNIETKYSIDINALLNSNSFKENVFFSIESLSRLGIYTESISINEYKELKEKDYEIVRDYYKQYKKNLSTNIKDIKKNPRSLFIKRNYKSESKHKMSSRIEELINFKICLAVNNLKLEYLKDDRDLFIKRYNDVYKEAKCNLIDEYKTFNKTRKLNEFILEKEESKDIKYFNNIVALHELTRLSLTCRAMGCIDEEANYIIENINIMFKNYVKGLLLDYSKVDLRNILYFNDFNQTILNLDNPLGFNDFNDMIKIFEINIA